MNCISLKKIITRSLVALTELMMLPTITLACENGIPCNIPDCPIKILSPSLSTSQSTRESNPNPAKRAKVPCPSPSAEPAARDCFPLLSQNSDLMTELLEFLTQEEILNRLKPTSKALCATTENCQPKVIKRTQGQEYVKFSSYAEYFLRATKNQIYSPNFTISFKNPTDLINFSNDPKAQSTAKKLYFVSPTSMPKEALNGFKKFKNLRSLEFSGLDGDSIDGIVPLIAELKNLEDFSLSSHWIQEVTGANLISVLKHLENFRKLDLVNISFNWKTASDIISLISSSPTFQSLSISTPRGYSLQDLNEFLVTLGSAIEKSKSLKNLKIILVNEGMSSNFTAAPLFSAIGKSASLEVVDFGMRYFNDDQAELAAESIKNLKTLKKFRCDPVNFGNRGAIAFASAIRASPSLESLIFTLSSVDIEGTKHLASAVQHSKILKHFELGYYPIYDKALAIWDYIRFSRPDIKIINNTNR